MRSLFRSPKINRKPRWFHASSTNTQNLNFFLFLPLSLETQPVKEQIPAQNPNLQSNFGLFACKAVSFTPWLLTWVLRCQSFQQFHAEMGFIAHFLQPRFAFPQCLGFSRRCKARCKPRILLFCCLIWPSGRVRLRCSGNVIFFQNRVCCHGDGVGAIGIMTEWRD